MPRPCFKLHPLKPSGGGCLMCDLWHRSARHRVAWGDDPQPRGPVTRRVRQCADGRWCWAVTVNGMTVARGSETTEAEARDECQKAGPQPEDEDPMIAPRWAYGVTTVPERRTELLPRTLASLAAGGFGQPTIFVDRGTTRTHGEYHGLALPTVVRTGRLGAFGNWSLALWELLILNPEANRFAVFQDDLVCVKGLKDYLDSCRYPDGSDGRRKGYWNLMTFLDSDNVVYAPGWVEGPMLNSGADPAKDDQSGRGALGLVFDREAVFELLSAPGFVRKPASTDRPRHCVDGAVVAAMNSAGRREYVHGPSLVSHTGTHTTIEEPGKIGKVWTSNARTFPGEGVEIGELMRGMRERAGAGR